MQTDIHIFLTIRIRFCLNLFKTSKNNSGGIAQSVVQVWNARSVVGVQMFGRSFVIVLRCAVGKQSEWLNVCRP